MTICDTQALYGPPPGYVPEGGGPLPAEPEWVPSGGRGFGGGGTLGEGGPEVDMIISAGLLQETCCGVVVSCGVLTTKCSILGELVLYLNIGR